MHISVHVDMTQDDQAHDEGHASTSLLPQEQDVIDLTCASNLVCARPSDFIDLTLDD